MVAVYARQSVDKKDSISIETQIDYCRAEAGSEEVRVYQDKGYSGSNVNRPAFRQLLEDVKNGEIRKVVIYKLDRMSRSLLDFSKLVDLFRQYRVDFQSTQEKFDTSTPIGNAMLSITMVFAQLERETIQQRIRDNYYSRGQKGMYLGGKPPFGYRKTDVTRQGVRTQMLTPESQEVALVERVFSLFADKGLSLGAIGRLLNRENSHRDFSQPNGGEVCSVEGRRFHAGNLNRLIRNPVYVRADAEVYRYFRGLDYRITNSLEDFVGRNGCYLYGKHSRGEGCADAAGQTLSVAPHEGCVESALWLRAQERLNASGSTLVSRAATGEKSWLGGLAVCGFCGSHMSVKTAVNKDRNTGEVKARYSYLSCNGRKYGSCTGALPKRGLSADAVEAVVEAQLLTFVQAVRFPVCEPKRHRGETEPLRRIALARLDEEIGHLIDAVASGSEVAGQYLNRRLEELDRQKSLLEKELEQLEAENAGGESQTLSQVLCRWEQFPVDQKRGVMRLLVNQITIRHGEDFDEIHICWKHCFPTEEVTL